MMAFSRPTITRMFENEPRVIILLARENAQQNYRSLLIIRAVYERVFCVNLRIHGETGVVKDMETRMRGLDARSSSPDNMVYTVNGLPR